ncbi:hypothetical protein [Nonomuraea soli]|uniref:Uncharacterized protein n=1 Tax=Nonomuraea soli TaxID=1032476 RepID=A0A7W0CV01_9ACTN|nr:hypothetical protein [Nonomuraea soli]MBA2897717.1 hypothetical protein [Nonomuraea soli]
MRFVLTGAGIDYEVSDDEVVDTSLGVLLTFEMSGFEDALDVLAAIDDTLSGRSPGGEFPFGAYLINLSRERVTFERTFGTKTERRQRPTSVLKDAAEAYWELLLAHRNERSPGVTYYYRPDLPLAWASLLLWEEHARRSHPYRGRLGIPAEGPSGTQDAAGVVVEGARVTEGRRRTRPDLLREDQHKDHGMARIRNICHGGSLHHQSGGVDLGDR